MLSTVEPFCPLEWKLPLITKLMDIMEAILSIEEETIIEHICSKGVRLLLLSVLLLSQHCDSSLYVYSVLHWHSSWMHKLRLLLKNNILWDFVVENYESLISIPHSPLQIYSLETVHPQEGVCCQLHYRSSPPSPQDALTNAILINEFNRRHRLRIVPKTYLPPHTTDLTTAYQQRLASAGSELSPGTVV